MNDLQVFLDSQAGIALKGALVAAFLDFATGVFAAAKDGTFEWGAIGAVLRKHILGRVGPLAVLLAGAYVSGDELLMTFAIGGLTLYAAETIASVKGNVMPPKESDILTDEERAAGAVVLWSNVNPVPTE